MEPDSLDYETSLKRLVTMTALRTSGLRGSDKQPSARETTL